MAHSATDEVWVCVVHCANCCRCRGSRGGLVHIVDRVPHKPANGSTYCHAPRLLAAIKSGTSMSTSRLPVLAADKQSQEIFVQRIWLWAAGVCACTRRVARVVRSSGLGGAGPSLSSCRVHVG